MNLNEYQHAATGTAVYPGQGTFQGLAYAALGLAGEAGETVEQVKKTWRDDEVRVEDNVRAILTMIRADLKGMLSHGTIMDRADAYLDEAFTLNLSDERREKIVKELGDCLWYAAQLATEIGASLEEVAQKNLDKLAARRAANNIHGEGSDR